MIVCWKETYLWMIPKHSWPYLAAPNTSGTYSTRLSLKRFEENFRGNPARTKEVKTLEWGRPGFDWLYDLAMLAEPSKISLHLKLFCVKALVNVS